MIEQLERTKEKHKEGNRIKKKKKEQFRILSNILQQGNTFLEGNTFFQGTIF